MHNGKEPQLYMPPPPRTGAQRPASNRQVQQTQPPRKQTLPHTQVRTDFVQPARGGFNPNIPPPHIERRNKVRTLSQPIANPAALKNRVHPHNKIQEEKQNGRAMLAVAVSFLIFYLLLVSSKIITDFTNNKHVANAEHMTHALGLAQKISTVIDNNILWINNGLSEGRSPQHSTDMISKSPHITASAILSAQKHVYALSPSGANYLTQVKLNNIQDNGVLLSSIIEKDGKIIPIIIKRTGDYYAVAALPADILLNEAKLDRTNRTGLVAKSGRIIAGNKGLGLSGARDWFHVKTADFEKITQANEEVRQRIRIAGSTYRIVSVPLPNSQLKLIESRLEPKIKLLQSDLVIFAILFIGTCALVAMLLNSLYKRINSIRRIQRQTEISQQRYQAAVEGNRGGIWELDIPNNTAYVSASLAGLLGLRRQEHVMPISQFLNLFHSHDRDRFLAIARRAHIQGEFEIDLHIAHLPLILQCRGRPSSQQNDNYKRVIVGVAVNITEQRGAQQSLKAAEARLHNALSSMTDSFVVWDQNNKLVLWNLRFEEFFNISSGKLHAGIDHASVDFLVKPSLIEVIPSPDNDGLSEIKLNDGRWIRYIETTTTEGGRVSVGTDVTEIRLREAELRENSRALKNTVDVLRKSQDRIVELADEYEQEKIRAEEANQSKTDFLSNMSHELRTPLNAINGFSDIMKKEMFGPLGDPRYKEYISDILFSGQHLLALINDILDMSKIEAGKMTLNTEVVFMHEMLAQVVRIIRGRANDSQLTLDITSTEVRDIEADPRAIKQILLNLITNAIKFTPEGGTVGAELIEKHSGIIIKITDSGIGISEDNIQRLAKPFEQVVDTGNGHKEGTGLGLALSKSLVELHGGNFKIESVLGKGTTVTFSLPNKPIQRAEEAKPTDVRQEISRLAQDIASVLGESEVQKSTALEATVLDLPPPMPTIENTNTAKPVLAKPYVQTPPPQHTRTDAA
ncbi:MAG: hypothetical protein COA43_09340 [Robiginitomaculum sp.]|nr:MAG: hypothetical protein COA43_09340 [Robiginitomaculum sp.]